MTGGLISSTGHLPNLKMAFLAAPLEGASLTIWVVQTVWIIKIYTDRKEKLVTAGGPG